MIDGRRIILTLLLAVITAGEASGQYFTAGNDPAGIRWSSIESEHFTVIYPSGSDSLARTYLSRLEYFRPLSFETMHVKGGSIPVVLHTHTTSSNGVVTWAPKRMDLFTSPEPYGGTPDPWTDQLVSHELRHQAQMELFSTGAMKILHYPFGESISGLGAGVYAGSPYLEGDATVTETEELGGGRGRSASFSQYYRMAWLNGDTRSRYRYLGGSYRYYTPNKYAYGYYMVSGFRSLTGDMSFQGNDMKSFIDNWINIPHAFTHYRKTVGKSINAVWDSTVTGMTGIWKRDLERRGTPTSGAIISSAPARYHTDYLSPVKVTCTDSRYTGSILAIKEGMNCAPVLVALDDDGKERVIRPFPYTHSDLEPSSDGRVYWSETKTAGGSTLENFSVIRYLDPATGKTRDIPHKKTKWFNPAVSPDASLLAVTEYPVTGSSFLVLIDTEDWHITDRTEAPGKGQIKESVITGEGIFATVILDRGLALYRLDRSGWTELIPQQNRTISHLRCLDGRIYFSSDLDGVLNIHTYDIATGTVARITNSLYGAEYPFPTGSVLLYSDFGTLGYRVVQFGTLSPAYSQVSFSEPSGHFPADMLTSQRKSQSTIAADSITLPDYRDESLYPARRYSRPAHLFRFHSWAPFYYNVDNIKELSYDKYYDAVSLGATLYSQNTLGTAVAMFGYSAHKAAGAGGSEWFHSGHVKFTCKGLCPFFELSADFNDRHRYSYEGPDPLCEGIYAGTFKTYLLAEKYPMHLRTSLRLYYPTYFSGGGWTRVLIPQAGWTFSNDGYLAPDGAIKHEHRLYAALTWSQVLPTATSQIYPRWGFGVTAYGAIAPGRTDAFGRLCYFYGYAYLPGFTRTSGFRLTGTWQKQFVGSGQYLLSSQATLPHGYTYFYPTQDFLKWTASYAIPVYLGDWYLGGGIGLYFKRMQLIPFYEWARDFGRTGVTRVFSAAGTDVLFDLSLLPFTPTVSIGVRYAYTGRQQIWTGSSVKDLGRNSFQMLFNITL